MQQRYQVYLEADETAARDVAELLGIDHSISVFSGLDAARHLYEVAPVLTPWSLANARSSARYARRLPQPARKAPPPLEQTIQGALRTSREVAVKTDFSRTGRSIVAVALDMAGAVACERGQYEWEETGGPTVPATDWAGIKVLLVGTGAYAGATVAALRERRADNVRVWSQSGRAKQFAADHGIDYSPSLDLDWPDVIVLCRGTGSPVLTADMVRDAKRTRGPLTLVDLARSKDVESEVTQIEDVTLIDLETVRKHVPAAASGDVENAQNIIAEGLAKLDSDLLGRTMDPLVVAVRNAFAAELEKELRQLPASGDIPASTLSAPCNASRRQLPTIRRFLPRRPRRKAGAKSFIGPLN